MIEEEKSNSEPVTMLLARTVRPDRLKDFEEWITGVKQVVTWKVIWVLYHPLAINSLRICLMARS